MTGRAITTPRPFQREGIRAIEWNDGRVLLSDEQGLGKTLQAVRWCWQFLPDDPPGPVVAVCPAHLKTYWQQEVRKHVDWHFEVLSGERAPASFVPPADPNAGLIISYNLLEQPRRDGKSNDATESWWWRLNRLNPRCVIGDEIHQIKEPGAARSRAFRKLCRGVPHLIFMSGTPMLNNPIELFNPVNILWPREFPSRFDFGQLYTHARVNAWGRWEFKGGRNLNDLNARLTRAGMIRRLKRDVLPQLPRKTVTVVPLELDRAGRKEYDDAADDFLTWLEKIDPTRARRAERAEGLTRLGYLRRLAASLKFPQVVAWTEDFLESSGGKLLAGAVHKSVVRPLAEAFGRAAVAVDGDLPTQERQSAFDRFNTDPRCKLLSGNYQAAGTGWSCRATSDVMLPELPWTPGELTQFIDRIHGLNRGVEGVAVNVYILVADDTIDTDLCQILQDKQGISDAALDGGPVEDSLNIFDELQRRTKRRADKRKVVWS